MTKDSKNETPHGAPLSRRDLAGKAAVTVAAVAVSALGAPAAAAAGFHGLDRGRALHASINDTGMKLSELRAAASRETDPGRSAIYRAAIQQVASGGAGDDKKFDLAFDLSKRPGSDAH